MVGGECLRNCGTRSCERPNFLLACSFLEVRRQPREGEEPGRFGLLLDALSQVGNLNFEVGVRPDICRGKNEHRNWKPVPPPQLQVGFHEARHHQGRTSPQGLMLTKATVSFAPLDLQSVRLPSGDKSYLAATNLSGGDAIQF